MRNKSTKLTAVQAATNEQAAFIIAEDPERYPDGSLMSLWADLILSKAAEAPADANAGLLFSRRAA